MTKVVPYVPSRLARLFFHAVIVFFITAAFPAAAYFSAPKTQAHLLLSATTARPGEVVWAGVQLDMPKGWHTYWRNGGDAGQPTEIKWTLPQGVIAGEIQWPVPEKEIDTAGDTSLITYVYTNEVVLLVPLTLDKSIASGPLKISAAATWMECSDICVPTGKDLSATLTVGNATSSSPDATAISAWREKLPQPDTSHTALAYWANEPAKGNARALIIQWNTNATPADFFPYGSTNYDMQGQTDILPGAGAIQLRKVVKKSDSAAEWPTQVEGELIGKAGTPAAFGLEEKLEIQSHVSASSLKISAPFDIRLLLLKLASAFLGGLILNVMPCVLPVLALKVLAFVSQSNKEPRKVREMGLVYGGGVLTSFLVLAILALAAQQAGQLANWGDLFRNSHFQIFLTTLMLLVALNLFGVFEVTLGSKTLSAASELTSRHGFSGAFFNGILATLLATPCTAPFLGGALAFAFTQPPLIIVLFFLTAGFGFAIPFVAICFNPRLLKFLPKPGAWMEKFKVAMGFPIIVAVVWLTWSSSITETDFFWIGLFLVVLALSAWIWGQFVQRGSKGKSAAIIFCLALIAADCAFVLKGEVHQKPGIDWKVWSPDAVEKARRDGHPVLVDFTAKSCLTCNLNLASSIDIKRTRAKLKSIDAVAFKADDTLDDPVIAGELRKFNTSGVPLVLVYSKDLSKGPQVLPTILTPDIVNAALDKAVN